MKKELKDHLFKMVLVASANDMDLLPNEYQFKVSKMNICKNKDSCINYLLDEWNFRFVNFAEGFLVNHACETCRYYEEE
jgi:hypothetical protein